MVDSNRIKQSIPLATILIPRSQLGGAKVEKVPPVSADAGASPNALAYAWLTQLISRKSAPRSPVGGSQTAKTTVKMSVPAGVISPRTNLSDHLAAIFMPKSSTTNAAKKAPSENASFRPPILRA